MKSEGESTDALHEDGETRSSDEVFVMKMERRSFPHQPIQIDTRKVGTKWKRQNRIIFLGM
jgi:hypothetical protein